MKKSLALATAALIPAAGLVLGLTPAHAATLSVTSPSCGAIKASENVRLDTGRDIPAGTTTGFPGGVYYAASQSTTQIVPVTVSPCSATAAKRTADGDFTNDGRADVMAITTGGDLMAYPMSSYGTLLPGKQVGRGFGAMIFMQRVTNGNGSALITVRNDGSVYRYTVNPGGTLGAAVKLSGINLTGYTNIAIVSGNNRVGGNGTSMPFGTKMVVAAKNGTLYGWSLYNNDTAASPVFNPTFPAPTSNMVGTGWGSVARTLTARDLDGNGHADIITIRNDGTQWKQYVATGFSTGAASILSAPVKSGSGWSAMTLIASPGSTDGDQRSDVIARRSDGNLYSYLSTGQTLGTAKQIGSKWNGIRLIG